MGNIFSSIWKTLDPEHGPTDQASTYAEECLIHNAVRSDNKDLLLAILNGNKWGEEANWADQKKVTGLHVAAAEGRLSSTRLLLEYGADSNLQDTCGMTPLHEAAAHGHAEIIEEIVNAQGYGALNCTDTWGWTPLQRALMNFHYRTATILLEHGCYVNIPDEKGRTALHVVASYGHVGMTSRLISKGGDVHHYDNKGWTPLMLAVVGGHVQVVRDLIHNGSDVSIRDFKDVSPLQLCSKGYPTIDKYKCALLLIEAGARCAGIVSAFEDLFSKFARGVTERQNLETSIRLLKLFLTAVGCLPSSTTQKALGWLEDHNTVGDYSLYIVKMVLVAGTLSLVRGRPKRVACTPPGDGNGPESGRRCPTLRDISRCSVRRQLAEVHGNVLCAMKNADLPFGLKEILLLKDI